MLLEPKVSFYAQETLLTAINTGDTRIISFLAENTNFPETLVKNICDSYRETVSYLLSFPQQQCYELIYSSSNSYLSLFFAKSSTGGMGGGIASGNNSTPMMNRTGSLGAMPFTPSGGKQQPNNLPTPSGSGANKGSFHNSFPPPAIPTVTNAKQQQGGGGGQQLHHQHLHPLEKFIKSLVFIKAIYSTLKNQLTLLEIKQLQCEMHHSGHHFPRRTTNNSAPWDNSQSLEFMKKLKHLVKTISFFYLDEFLNELLIPALESTTNEFANIVNYYLLRLLLLSLGDSNSENNNIPDNSFDILSCHRRKHKSEVKRLFSLSMSLDSENNLAEISTPMTVKSEGLLDEFVQLQPLLSLTLKKLFLNPEQEEQHNREEEEEEAVEEETKPENEISPTNDSSEEDQNKEQLLSSSSTEKNQKPNKKQTKKKSKKNQTYVRYNSIWISLFDRTTSMSKVLSTVSMQCIETILSIAPPLFMLETLSLPPLRMKQTDYESILTTMKSSNSQISLLAANHPSNNPNSMSSTSGNTTAATSSSSSMFSTPSSAATASQSSITEVWNIRKIEDYQMNFADTLKKYLNYYSASQNNTAVSGNEFKRDDLKNSFYNSLTIQQLLKKLYHQGDSWNIVMFSAIIANSAHSLTYLDADKLLDPMDTLLYPAATLVNEQTDGEFDHSSPSSPTNNSTYYLYNDFIIEKYYRRLSNNYYTMKLDEQISFSKLIYDFFIYCSFFIIINPNELINKQSLQLLLQFLNKINYLLNEMETKYLKNITDIQKKLTYFKLYLSEEAKDYLVMSREREFEEKLKVLSNNPVNPSQTSSVASSSKFGGPQQLPQTPLAVQEKQQQTPVNSASAMVTPMKSQPPSQSQSASSAQQQTPASASKSSFLFKRTLSSFLNRAGDSSLETNSSHHKDTPASNPPPAATNPSNPSPVGGSPMNSTHNNPSTHSDKGDSGPSKTKLKKFIENETLQVQSMITGYLILQEISMELYSFLYAIDSLKQLFQQNFMNVQAQSSSSPASSPWKVSGKNGGGDMGSPFVIGGLSSNSFEMELSATTKVTAEKQPRGEEREGGEFFINDYEEDEKELEEMKQLLNSFGALNMNNNNSKSYTNTDETEFLMEFNSLQLSLDQMISAVY
jgi:hypothetical protein